MKTKLDLKDLDRGLPDWLMELLPKPKSGSELNAPTRLEDRNIDVFWLEDRDVDDWLYQSPARTYKRKVAIADFFFLDGSEITELFATLETHGIEFCLVGRAIYRFDTLGIVMWRLENWTIAMEFLHNRGDIPWQSDEPKGSVPTKGGLGDRTTMNPDLSKRLTVRFEITPRHRFGGSR